MEASGFTRMLQDDDFQFFLQLFNQIMPHVDKMYQQQQKKDIDAVFIKCYLALVVGAGMTVIVQSSSVFISALNPLIVNALQSRNPNYLPAMLWNWDFLLGWIASRHLLDDIYQQGHIEV
ncbi:unnamed protein product [Lota lota]